MIAAAGQASDVEICDEQNVKDHDDQTLIASHLLEHGVQDTERSHVLFFQGCLFNAMKKLDTSVTKTLDQCTILISNMDAFLHKEARVVREIAWARNLCDACERFENQDSYNVCKTYEHKRDFSSLVSSSDNGCNLCHFLSGISEESLVPSA